MQRGLMQVVTRDQAVDWEDVENLIAIINKYCQFYTSFEKGKLLPHLRYQNNIEWALMSRGKDVFISLPCEIIGYFPLSLIYLFDRYLLSTYQLMGGQLVTSPLYVWFLCAVIIELARSCYTMGAER